jgi:hypothetical protein
MSHSAHAHGHVHGSAYAGGVPAHMVEIVGPAAKKIKTKHFKVGQPLITLKPSQKQIVRAMTAREQQAAHGLEARDRLHKKVTVFSTVACLANDVGWGKTAAAIALILLGEAPNADGGCFKMRAASAYTQQRTQPSTATFQRTLIVLGKALIQQWEKAFADVAGDALRVQYVKTKKDVAGFDAKHDNQNEHHVTVVCDARYRELLARKDVAALKWSRLIIDELHTCGQMGTVLAKANFNWLLNATVPLMLQYNNTIARQLFGSTANDHGGAGFCMRSDDEVVRQENVLPHRLDGYLRCAAAEAVHPLAMQALDDEGIDRLHANAVSIEELKQSILLKLQQTLLRTVEELTQAQAKLDYRTSHAATADRIAAAHTSVQNATAKRNNAQRTLDTTTHQLEARFDEQCCVCMEDFETEPEPEQQQQQAQHEPEQAEAEEEQEQAQAQPEDTERTRCLLRCQHFLCLPCAVHMQKSHRGNRQTLFLCPQCRQPVPVGDEGLRVVKQRPEAGTQQHEEAAEEAGQAAEPDPKPLNKADTLVALIQGNRAAFGERRLSNRTEEDLTYTVLADVLQRHSEQLFVVAAKHRETLEMLKAKFESCQPPIRYSTLRAGNSLPHIMKRLRTKEVRVLLLKSESDGSGLDGLQHLARDFVFVEYHKLSDAAKKQAVGRVWRYSGPNTASRRVTVLSLHDGNEYDTAAVDAANQSYAQHLAPGTAAQ